MNHTLALQLALGVPLVASLLILLLGRRPNLREAVTLASAGGVFACVASLLPAVFAGGSISLTLFEMLPGAPLRFDVEPLGMVYALVATLLWIPNSVYSIGYMRGGAEKNQTRFFACFPVAIMSSVGIAFAGNVLTMFVFYELLTLSTLPLVMHKGTQDAMRSGRVYLGVLLTTSICFQLFAVLWIYVLAQSGTISGIDFVQGGMFQSALAAGTVAPALLGLLFFLYIYGIGKSALMPVHRWLPAAMVAPTPVSAFLHAVAVVKAGVFCVVKVIVYVFGPETLRLSGQANWLLYAAGLTIVTASMIALFQDNLKKRLAYSTISQLAYVTMAAALFTPAGVMAATIHIVAHALGKITLFFSAGSIYIAAHKTQVSQLDGIGRRMPFTMAAFTLGALSMIGMPPLLGLASKWYLGRAVAESWQLSGSHGDEIFVVCVIVISTLLNGWYFIPIVYRAFFKPLSDEDRKHPHGEAPLAMVYATCFTAALAVMFFFWTRPIMDLAELVRRAA